MIGMVDRNGGRTVMTDAQARVAGTVAPSWLASYPKDIDWHARYTPAPLGALLDRAVAQWPEQRCVDFLDRAYSYREIGSLVARAAKGLQGLGVGPGVKVGLFLPNCPYAVVMFFAVLKVGGTVVNFNPLYAPREIEHQIEDSETDLMVTLDLQLLLPKLQPLLERTRLRTLIVCRMANALPFPKNLLFPWIKRKEIAAVPAGPAYVWFERLIDNDGESASVAIDPARALAVLQYTGGTTGVPKGAAHTHASLHVNAEQLAAWSPGCKPAAERVLGILPLFHVFAMTAVMLYAVRIGAEMILLPRYELDQLLATIDRKKPTVMPGVPTLYTAIANHPRLGSYDLTSLKLCIAGGAALPLEVKQAFERRSGCTLVEGYGLTEAPVTHCNPISGRHKTGSIGLPMPGTSLEVVSLDDRRTPLPPGERGEICIRGPQVMQGYWRREAETAQALEDGRLHTGDVGYLDEDGYAFIVDRLKELIICSGYNVYPRMVEEAIYEHPAVAEAAVVGMPDPYRGETVKAFVVRGAGASLSAEELLAFLKDKLSPIEMPKQIAFRDSLPKSAVGKILKRELLRQEQERSDAA
jgi:long-chain acyl-CoA synthetase